MHRSKSEEVVPTNDRGRRLRLIEKRFDKGSSSLHVPHTVEPFQTWIWGDVRRDQRTPVATVPLLNHRPRDAGRDKRDPYMPLSDEMTDQSPAPIVVGGRDREDRLTQMIVVLEHHARNRAIGKPRRVPRPDAWFTGQQQERGVRPSLEHRGEQVGRAHVRSSRLDQ